MKDWYIEDRGGDVYVLYGETYTDKKQVYPDINHEDIVNFFILYNENKTVGYQLTYKYDEKHPKFLTYNSFGIVYNKRKIQFSSSFEVIFEDAVVRFLTWEHKKENEDKPYARDYFLVGRWRSGSGNGDTNNG